MTTIQIELPDTTANAERVAAAGIPPMSMKEINAEAKAARC